MAKRAVVRLQLDGVAKEDLDKLCGRRGMTQITILSRLVRWFGQQDEVVQASVLGLLSDKMLGDLSRTLLSHSRVEVRKSNVVPETATKALTPK